MKCVCGYSHLTEWEASNATQEERDAAGEYEFLQADTTIYVQTNYASYGDDGMRKKNIYACPECGTLKIDVHQI